MSHATPSLYVFLMLRTLPAWLALPRDERANIASAAFKACQEVCPGFSWRHFDAEAFSTTCTDLVMMDVADVTAYSFAIEALRDSPLFSFPYFEMVAVIPALEDGYRAYEETMAAAS